MKRILIWMLSEEEEQTRKELMSASGDLSEECLYVSEGEPLSDYR